MMFKTSFLVLSLVCLSSSAFCPPSPRRIFIPMPEYRSDVTADVARFAIGAGCIAAFCYGAYKVGQWLFGKTDEQILKESSLVLSDVTYHFTPLVTLFGNNQCKNIDEPFLYQYANQLSRDKKSIQAILSDLGSGIPALKSSHETMNTRLIELQRKRQATLFESMRQVNESTAVLLHKLESIHQCLQYHNAYFVLYEKEAVLMGEYEQSLLAVEHAGGNPLVLKEQIRMIIMAYASKNRIVYPYMYYIEKISRDCSQLDQMIRGLSGNYANRANAAYNLLQRLQIIYNVLLTDDVYLQELRDYERAKIEKQRLEAEQAKAAAAQAHAAAAHAQAAALQAQAWELAHQNQLQAAQIQLQQEQNALIAAQTIVNAINPPQQVTVVEVYQQPSVGVYDVIPVGVYQQPADIYIYN